eukprot:2170177-Pleurochrysis_carterae.AAC.2
MGTRAHRVLSYHRKWKGDCKQRMASERFVLRAWLKIDIVVEKFSVCLHLSVELVGERKQKGDTTVRVVREFECVSVRKYVSLGVCKQVRA